MLSKQYIIPELKRVNFHLTFLLTIAYNSILYLIVLNFAHVAQSVEHILGKDVVAGSIPAVGLLLKILIFNNLQLIRRP